jgi:hypothetical protein
MYTGTHDGATMYSTISFNVDEFKLFKILRNVLGESTEKLWDVNDTFSDDECWDLETKEESENRSDNNNNYSEL